MTKKCQKYAPYAHCTQDAKEMQYICKQYARYMQKYANNI